MKTKEEFLRDRASMTKLDYMQELVYTRDRYFNLLSDLQFWCGPLSDDSMDILNCKRAVLAIVSNPKNRP